MVDGVSNLSSSLSMRVTVSRLQRELLNTRTEAATGKVADRGLALGQHSSLSVDLAEQVKRIDTIRSMNANVSARLDATQHVLDSMRDVAKSIMQQFAQAKSAGGDMRLVQKAAAGALDTLNDKLNASFNGQYLFAGVNTDVRPVSTDPNDPATAGRGSIDTAFQAQFGMTQTDPAVTTLSASAIGSFLDGEFSSLFDDDGWRANFSGASEKVIRSRVSMSEIVDSSISADAQPFRDITRALQMVAATGIEKMGRDAAQATINRAIVVLGSGQQGLTEVQASLGAVQTRVGEATDRLTIQSQSLAKTIGSVEDVDPYEVSVRLNSLQTQIETAYALTSRMQNLSLLKYL